MMVGRFGMAIPALVFAGLFARQKIAPRSIGTLPTDSFSFGLLLIVFLVIVTALSYLPVFTLGPLLETPPLQDLGAILAGTARETK